MNNICIVPAFRRPEYLHECLKNIAKADGVKDLLIMVVLDQGYSEDNIDIINQSELKDQIFIYKTPYRAYKLSKQSFSVLNSVIGACKNADIVYYVEEDIFISKDFFTFAADVMKAEPGIFAFVGTASHNVRVKTTDNKNAYYLTDKADFQTHGDCYNAKLFLQYVSEHFNDKYFANPRAYCNQFNSKVCNPDHVEQDGLIRRVIEKNNLLIAYPHVPRAQHSGIYGYNRQTAEMHLDYSARLKFIQDTVYDSVKMRQYDKYNDSQPCNMSLSHTKIEHIKII